MKKELIVVGECILWIIILVIVKIVLESFFSTLEDNQIIKYVLYLLSGMGFVLIYRLNKKRIH